MSFSKVVIFLSLGLSTLAQNWPQASGPNGDYQVKGQAPIEWSVVRNENIKWRTPMPEAGQAAVTVWGDKLFTTVHKPIESEGQKGQVKDIIALCLDAESGKILWQKEMPGAIAIDLANGFSDGTVFSPLCDGEKVWFFNRCGQMACFDLGGKEIWKRDFVPRYMHANRQAEPSFVGDTILYVEIAEKKKEFINGVRKDSKIKKKYANDKGFWTYIHGLDKNTGEVLWREENGTVIHCNPMVGKRENGAQALLQVRGGGHAPVETPYGFNLMSLEPRKEGQVIWQKPLKGIMTSANLCWNEKYVPLFVGAELQIYHTESGELFKKVDLLNDVQVHKKGETSDQVTIKAKKGKALTYFTNILVGDDYYFLSHSAPYLGKVNMETSKLEYLELPAQLIPGKKSRSEDIYIHELKKIKNDPVNQNNLHVGNKGHDGSGFGHISSACPILVGKHLIIPVVTGTVYVIDTTKAFENGEALVAVNDLGEEGKTWTLSSFSYSEGKLYAHTMKELICIKGKDNEN